MTGPGGGSTVWLASYPKSGNTWLRATYAAWTGGCPPDLRRLPGRPLASDRGTFDEATGLASSQLRHAEVDALRPIVDEVVDDGGPDPNGLRLRKIHDAARAPGAAPIVSAVATRAVLYVVRDPRDVAVSSAHHAGIGIEEAAAMVCDPAAELSGSTDRLHTQLRQRLGRWSDHVGSWLDPPVAPTLCIRYEDCVARPAEEWRRVLAFLRLASDGDRVERAVADSSLAVLQAQERRNGFVERQTAGAAFFRRGEPGAWRRELPAPLARQIEAANATQMRRLGYL